MALTADHLRSILDYDPETGRFIWLVRASAKVWPGQVAGSCNPRGYRRISFEKTTYLAHRLAWLYVHGKWPKGLMDHINGDRDDNRLVNLRVVNAKQNCWNRCARKNSRSGLKGAYYHSKNLWFSSVETEGKVKLLGYFRTPEAAHAAYTAAAAEIFGEFVYGARP